MNTFPKGKEAIFSFLLIVATFLLAWALDYKHYHEIFVFLVLIIGVVMALLEWSRKVVSRTVRALSYPRQFKFKQAIWTFLCLFVAITFVALPVYVGRRGAKVGAVSHHRAPCIVVIGDMTSKEGFGLSVKEYLQNYWKVEQGRHKMAGVTIELLNIPEERNGNAGRVDRQLRKNQILTGLMPMLAKQLPIGAIVASSSGYVDDVLDQLRKFGVPTVIVSATKSGVVSYTNNVLRFLPPNLAQANELAEIRRQLLKERAEAWEMKLEADAKHSPNPAQFQRPLEEWRTYVRLSQELNKCRYDLAQVMERLKSATTDRLDDRQLEYAQNDKEGFEKRIAELQATLKSNGPPSARPPKVIFGFIHDGSEFAVDLKSDFFSLSALDDPMIADSTGMLVFNASNELAISESVRMGQLSKVEHWFVALYDKRAQDFYRTKTALEIAFPEISRASVTYCDSAYGHWMFGNQRKNTAVVLPVYRPDNITSQRLPPLLIQKEKKIVPRAPLTAKESCYGPFAYDAVLLFAKAFRDYSSSPNGTFAEYFHDTVVAAYGRGESIVLETITDGGAEFHPVCRNTRLYVMEKQPDELRQQSDSERKRILLRHLKESAFTFQRFDVSPAVQGDSE